MPALFRLAALGLIGAGAVLAASGCESAKRPPTETFYQRRIAPILNQSCSNSPTQSGCHVAADDRGNAFGNLDLESYETLSRRRDLLIEYGPYNMPALLVKVVPDFQLRLTTWQSDEPTIITTDIPHAGEDLLDITSTAFSRIQSWIERGATENNSRARDRDLSRGKCTTTVGNDPAFDPSMDPTDPDYGTFEARVNGVLGERCAAGNCHSSPTNSLYLTCGKTDEQKRWNYFVASDYISTDAASSELLRRALAQQSGGTYHEGGDIFSSTDASGYRAILAWAEEKGGPPRVPAEPGFEFFAQRVQPMLVKKGCMLIGCHSPAMGHDYRLRGGSGGHFGLAATRRNYELTLDQVALHAPDPTASRILRKNMVPKIETTGPRPADPRGITHRGGSLFGRGIADCDLEAARTGPLDEQEPFCVISAWIAMEREARLGDAVPFESILYVTRPPTSGPGVPQDFETFVPGADLLRAPASFTDDGSLEVGGGESLLPLCGLGADVDVRRPAVSWDGTRIAFSARTGADQPWQVYVIDGSTCTPDPVINAPPVDESGSPVGDNGELIHNFDPAFSPDGRIVFASTRGNVMNTQAFDYQGPQRTPADPSRLNANLYVAEGDQVRQLTFLLNQEMTPSFMADGRLIMVTEKRAPGFYQLAGRRQNLDGGDYHPLFGQRATIGFNQLTDVVELADKNFVAIFSDRGAQHGGGALAIVNRSLGIDQPAQDEKAYLQDPSARTWQNPDFFQHSIHVLDGVGKPGEGGRVYRSPAALPNGNVLISMADGVGDVGGFGGGFDLYVVDPIEVVRYGPVVQSPDDVLWPVAVHARDSRQVYHSKLDEPNGATRVDGKPGQADVLFLDVPLLSSLLFQNTRAPRIFEDSLSTLQVWESLPPESGVDSFDAGGEYVTSDDFGQLYVRRRKLGAVTPHADGSARIAVPGGMPIVLATQVELAGDDGAQMHHQREEMQFYPGEVIRQSFRRELFNGVCGSCHGAVSGFESDVAINPDILTQASVVDARDDDPTSLLGPAGDPKGPPFP